jgi:hypothetical protein
MGHDLCRNPAELQFGEEVRSAAAADAVPDAVDKVDDSEILVLAARCGGLALLPGLG